MDFSEMKVTERQQNAGPCSRFTVQEPEQKVIVRSGSMMAKVSLCLGVLLIALVLELGGTAKDRQRQVFAAEEKRPEATARAENLGAIYYVETDAAPTAPGAGADVKRVKWAPPVRSDEVTLLREDSVVGFSALDTQISCCCGARSSPWARTRTGASTCGSGPPGTWTRCTTASKR